MGAILRSVLLLVLVVAVSSRTIKTLVEECKKSVEISDELEKSFLELEFPEDERATHCLFNCIGEMLQLFDAKSGANLKNIKVLLKGENGAAGSKEEEEDISEEQRKCVVEAEQEEDEDEQDECLPAFRVYKCFEQDFLALMKKELEAGEGA